MPRIDPPRSSLRPGDWVEVRDEAAITATLDGNGTLDGVVFMPEMRRYCGRRLKVFRRAEGLCVEGSKVQRRIEDAVLLGDLRCDGSAHGGCQRGCLLFWKAAWLRRVEGGELAETASAGGALAAERSTAEESMRRCQSTELLAASCPVSRWAIVERWRAIRGGDTPIGEVLLAVACAFAARLMLLRGTLRRRKRSSEGAPPLALQVGERVRVRSLVAIDRTLDRRGRLRGLEFCPAMALHCGRTYRVARRVDRIVLEKTGESRPLRDTVALEGTACPLCPRRNDFYWRESWLERVD